MKRLLLVLVLVLVFATQVYAIPMTSKLSWTQPTTTVDGQPLNVDTALTGSKIYCGKSSGTYTVTKVLAPDIIIYPVKDVPLTVGNWYCVVTSSNKYGESAYSNEKSFSIDGALPNAPALEVVP